MRVVRWAGAVALTVLLGGCTGDPAPDDPVDAEPVEAEPAAPAALAPLTGQEVVDPDVLERPVLAVKVDNAAAARPQVGLDAADIVLEELVEGGQTRFVALYHAETPAEVGPVRSGREVDAELLPAFEPVLALSGAAAPVWALLRDAELRVFEEGRPQGGFRRESGRRAPHNLMVTPSALWEASEGRPAVEPWPIGAAPSADGDAAERVDLDFSPQTVVTWRWDGDGWLRHHDGQPHLDAEGRQLRADTVVVARVAVGPGGRTDSGGNPTVAITVSGEGEALVLRDGRAYPGRWSKAGAGDQFAWLDPSGAPLPVAPGRTWVELVPTAGDVTLDAEPDAS